MTLLAGSVKLREISAGSNNRQNSELCGHYTYELHLFASRMSKQFDCYVSYRPHPGAYAMDAFSLCWKYLELYVFPLSAISLKFWGKCTERAQKGR